MKIYIARTLLAMSLFLLTGCFDFLNPANKKSATTNKTSAITQTQFSGVASAINKISGILVTWPSVSDSSLVKAYKVYRVTGSTKSLVASLAPSLTSYLDGSVEPGAIYTYMVNAVDQDDIEDSNTKIARSLAWPGIDTVAADSRSSLVVTFKTTTAVADEIRVYGQLAAGGVKTLLATASGNDVSVALPGLRTGYTYIISAQAYVAALGKEDGNDLTVNANTYTVGYDTDGASSAQWANVMSVRAFGEAPAAPVHPTTPAKSPSTRVVELAFNQFSSIGSNTKYVVTRVIDGFTMDSSVTTACTDTTFTSCRVCDQVSSVNGVVNCVDSAVAASPARYRYSLSMIQTDTSTGDTWAEPLPTDQDVLAQFSVLVPIPPKNMILVQRDAANYEMCLQLGKASDPANHNRCLYSGIGGQPFSTGNNKLPLNLSPGYYDFGYNLFVDRWELACNWTMASQGGMCGPNHTSGDCIGFGNYTGSVGAPTATQGKVGDVFLWLYPGGVSCRIATSADSSGNITWMTPTTIVDSALPNAFNLYKTMSTNDPGYIDSSGNYDLTLPGKRAKQNAYLNQYSAAGACASQVDSNYGVKRLSRKREYVVYSAPALLQGEPYTYSSYTNFLNRVYKVNSYHNSSYTYGCEYGTNQDVGAPNISQLLDSTNYPAYKEMLLLSNATDSTGYSNFFGSNSAAQFMIGSVATIDCQSRYGVQDMLRAKFMSDIMYFDKSTGKVLGLMSPFDNGNRDLLQDISGSTTGFIMDATSYVQDTTNSYGTANSTSTYITGFIPPLGMPIVNSTFSSDYWPRALWTQTFSSTIQVPLLTSTALSLKSVRAGSRWGTYVPSTMVDSISSEIRCVLPAEQIYSAGRAQRFTPAPADPVVMVYCIPKDHRLLILVEKTPAP